MRQFYGMFILCVFLFIGIMLNMVEIKVLEKAITELNADIEAVESYARGQELRLCKSYVEHGFYPDAKSCVVSLNKKSL